MRKIWLVPIAAVLLSVFGYSPFRTTDVARLEPVQTMVITASVGKVRVDCGEKLVGQGADLESALADLKAGADGTVFLATAQQIVVSGEPVIWEQLTRCEGLRPAARLYQAKKPPGAQQITEFLLRDQTPATLLELRIARLYEHQLTVPVLVQGQGGYRIVSGKPV